MLALMRFVGTTAFFLMTTVGTIAAAPLTDDEATRVVAATRELSPVIAKHQGDWSAWAEKRADAAPRADDPCAIPADAKDVPGYGEILDIVEAHGFADGEAYCRTSMRLYSACMANQMAQQDPAWREKVVNREQHAADARRQMEASLAELDADQSLPPEQKQQIRQKMTEMLAQMDAVKDNPMLAAMETVSDEDMKTAEPHCAGVLKSHQQPATKP